MATSNTRKIISLAPSIALNTAFIFLVVLSHCMGFQYTKPSASPPKSDACASLHEHADKCRYVETHSACKPKGYINYLHIFYCELSQAPPGLGHVALILWLFVLFYLLADTASEYFCPSLDGLSKTLRCWKATDAPELLKIAIFTLKILSIYIFFLTKFIWIFFFYIFFSLKFFSFKFSSLEFNF